jgi:hypothetical protein
MNIEERDAANLANELQKRGFSISKDETVTSLKEKSHFTALDSSSIIRLDGKGACGPRELESLRTRRKITIDEIEYYVASPEDMIANKLLSGGEQDVRDAEGIYARQLEHLDMGLLRGAAKKLGVSKELGMLERRIARRITRLPSDGRR